MCAQLPPHAFGGGGYVDIGAGIGDRIHHCPLAFEDGVGGNRRAVDQPDYHGKIGFEFGEPGDEADRLVLEPIDWSSGVDNTLATRKTPRSGSSASRSVNVPPTSTPICHAIRYSSPSCCASRSLTHINAPGPAVREAARLSDSSGRRKSAERRSSGRGIAQRR